MLPFEQKLMDFLRKHAFAFIMICGIAFSLWMRWVALPMQSSDMNTFLLSWYQHIVEQGGGIQSLAGHPANYNAAYLYLLALVTKLPIAPITAIKLISILGDYLLALAVSLPVYRYYHNNKRLAGLAFLAVSLLPGTIVNSAFWGQCDSIYTAFLVFCVYYIMRNKPWLAFAFFGLGLCFKLQAIFLLPFLLLLYAATNWFSILAFLLPPAMLWGMSLPIVLYGAPITMAFDIYKNQTEQYHYVFINYPNIATFFVWGDIQYMAKYMVAFTLLVFAATWALMLYRRPRLNADTTLLLAGWSVITCALFLPFMHERYGYAGEILLLIWLAFRPQWRRALPVVSIYLVGFLSSAQFIFGNTLPNTSPLLTLAYLACYAALSHTLFTRLWVQGTPPPPDALPEGDDTPPETEALPPPDETEPSAVLPENEPAGA